MPACKHGSAKIETRCTLALLVQSKNYVLRAVFFSILNQFRKGTYGCRKGQTTSYVGCTIQIQVKELTYSAWQPELRTPRWMVPARVIHTMYLILAGDGGLGPCQGHADHIPGTLRWRRAWFQPGSCTWSWEWWLPTARPTTETVRWLNRSAMIRRIG